MTAVAGLARTRTPTEIRSQRSRERQRQVIWFLAAVSLDGAIALLDTVYHDDAVLITVLLVGPFVAAAFLPALWTLAVVAWATVLAIGLGVPDGIFGSDLHVLRVASVLLPSLLAVATTRIRQRHEYQARHARPLASTVENALLRPVPSRPRGRQAWLHSSTHCVVMPGARCVTTSSCSL